MADENPGAAAVVEQPAASNDGIDDSRFQHSVSYTPDEPAPKGEIPAKTDEAKTDGKTDSERARDEKGKFVKQEEGKTEKPALKIPESMKPAKPKDPNDITARFHDLSRSHEDVRRELAEARRLLQELRTPKTEPAKTEQPKSYSGQPRPKSEDFETYDAFQEALTNWQLDERDAKAKAEQQDTQSETFYVEREQTFYKNAGPVLAEVPELMDIIKQPNLAFSVPMMNAIMDPDLGEMGPYTALWLATHQQEAIEIYKKSPLQATIAVGRLAQRLEAELRAEAAKETAAPPKPKLVPDLRGSVPATGDLDGAPSDDDNINVWAAKQASIAEKRGLRTYRPRGY